MICLDDTPDLEESLASPLWRRIIPVTGACGGSGKTSVAAALARALAALGLRVHAVDLCGADGALHLALGEPLHRPGLGAFMREAARWEDVSHPSAVPGLTLTPADRLEEIPSLFPPDARRRLMERLVSVPCDAMVLDLGTGTTALAREILLASPHPLIVSRASIVEAAASHAVLRGALAPLLHRWFSPQDLEGIPTQAGPNPPALSGLFEHLRAKNPRRTYRFLSALERYTPFLLLSRVEQLADLEWLRRLREHLSSRSMIKAVPAGGLPSCENFAGDPRVKSVLTRMAQTYAHRVSERHTRHLAAAAAAKIPA
jgi:MinD-like ATPase involved in chromosome partitioning or flagellar assembly